jgi:hypothetical protein
LVRESCTFGVWQQSLGIWVSWFHRKKVMTGQKPDTVSEKISPAAE